MKMSEQPEPTPDPPIHRTKYRNDMHGDIILEVPEPPMGSGSGWIPPPLITFFHQGQEVQFGYQGEAPDAE